MLFAYLLVAAVQAPPSAPDSLTLDAALALARARRGQVVAAAALVAGARADYRVAGTIPNPVVTYSHTESVPRGHATVDQSLDWLLVRGSDRAAGAAGVRGAVADSERTVRGVEHEVRSAFYGLLAALRVASLANDEALFADSLARIAQRRFAAGEIAQLESSQATLEATRVAQLASQAREALASARYELGRAIGAPLDSLAAPAGALDDHLSDSLARPSTADLPAVQRARADSAATASLATSASRARIPFPSLQLGLEWDDPTVPDQKTFGIIGVSFPFPLWQQGGGAAAAASARAGEAAALVREAIADQVALRASATVRLTESRARALVARDSILPLATQQRELALRAYRAGETGLVPVLDALRAEREVAQDLVAELLAFQEARAAWLELNEGGR